MHFNKEERRQCYKILQKAPYFPYIKPYLTLERLERINLKVEGVLVNLNNNVKSRKQIVFEKLWILYEDCVMLILFSETDDQRVYSSLVEALQKRFFGKLKGLTNKRLIATYDEKQAFTWKVFSDFIIRMMQGKVPHKVDGTSLPTLEKYLFGIFGFQYKSFCRKRKKDLNKTTSNLEEAFHLVNEYPNVLRSIQAKEILEAIQDVLSEKEWKLIELRFKQQLSFKEIAAKYPNTYVSEAAAKQMVSRIRKKLRDKGF